MNGNVSPKEVTEDFTIVATASVHNLELIYSDDKATMLSKEAVDAYTLVNDLHNLPTPDFRSYDKFIQELKKPLRRQRK